MAVEDASDPPPSGPFPDYPQMIISAIEVLNEKEGSSKLAISNYIESNYSDLPPAHSTLLSNTLEKLKLAGQLVFSNGNYLKAEAGEETPAKRGRGRPPKPKDPLAADVVSSSPRPRGRPPKPRDPLGPGSQPMKTSSGSGRPRGRPRKYPKEAAPVAPAAVPGMKRGRGRPPKVKA